jgi:hypothetical protein
VNHGQATAAWGGHLTMGGHALHSERRVLRHVTRELSSSDPGMVLLFVNFTRLTHGEELPRTERLAARGAARPWWRGARLRMVYVFALFLVTLVACWALAMVSTGGAHRNGPVAPRQQLTGANSSCANLHELERYLSQLESTPASAAPC